MVESHESDGILNVPVEATAFLAAVSAFAVFLLVIFIYVNKKWRILNVGFGGSAGGASKKSGKSLGKTSVVPLSQSTELRNDQLDGSLQFNSPLCTSVEEYAGSFPDSSDSEEDVLRRLRQHQQQQQQQRQQLQAGYQQYQEHHHQDPLSGRPNYVQHHPLHQHMVGSSSLVSRGSPRQMSPRSISVDGHYGGRGGHHSSQHHHHQQTMHQMAQHRSFDNSTTTTSSHIPSHQHHQMQLVSTSSSHHHPLHLQQQHHPHAAVAPSPSSSFTSQSIRPLRVAGVGEELTNSSSKRRPHSKGLMRSSIGSRITGDSTDLISLAEKGKVNGGSSASSTSSNGSADDDPSNPQQLQQHQPNTQQGTSSVIRHHHSPPPPSSSSSASVIRTGVGGGDSSRNSNNDTTTNNTPQAHSSNSLPHNHHPPHQHHPVARSSSQHALISGASHHHHHLHSSAVSSSHHQQALAIASTSTNFRRMMMPPRTKSLDSESPPPSEQGLSTYGDSIADQDDHIFEVEEISLVEGDLGMVGDSSRSCPTSPVQCGSVEVGFDYDAVARKMTVHIIQVRGIPPKDIGGANNTQVRVVLLPGRKQKHKTKVRPGENPSFMETFVFTKINPEDVSSLGVRFRLYGCERMRRERLLGECILEFGSLHLELETTIWLNLEPRYHLSWDSRSETSSLARSDSASSTASIQSGIPELLVGLAYNGTTGRLTCEIIKGSHFRQLAGGRAPDSYIKLVLVNTNGQEMGRAKTSLRRAQSNPLFKETFMFQVALFQIQEVTLLVSVYGRKGVTRRELLGWFALGYNSSGDEETTHWEDMCDAQGDQMCRWHVLQT